MPIPSPTVAAVNTRADSTGPGFSGLSRQAVGGILDFADETLGTRFLSFCSQGTSLFQLSFKVTPFVWYVEIPLVHTFQFPVLRATYSR